MVSTSSKQQIARQQHDSSTDLAALARWLCSTRSNTQWSTVQHAPCNLDYLLWSEALPPQHLLIWTRLPKRFQANMLSVQAYNSGPLVTTSCFDGHARPAR